MQPMSLHGNIALSLCSDNQMEKCLVSGCNGLERALSQLQTQIKEHPKISVVICTLNEESNLPKVLPKIPSWVDEVILVDGHSTDNTVAVARSILPTIQVLYQPRNGKDDAMKHGFKNAAGDIIVVLDADGSTDPEQIPELVCPLLDGYDFVKGSRFLKANPNMSLRRKLGNKMLIALTNLLFGTRFTDVCCGYNAFWKRCLDKVKLSDDSFDYEPVLHVKIKKAGFRVAEVPCRDTGRISGTSKLPMLAQGLKAAIAILHQRLLG
jgi:glycosyltransferase involved in cell wall biosynthesis